MEILPAKPLQCLEMRKELNLPLFWNAMLASKKKVNEMSIDASRLSELEQPKGNPQRHHRLACYWHLYTSCSPVGAEGQHAALVCFMQMSIVSSCSGIFEDLVLSMKNAFEASVNNSFYCPRACSGSFWAESAYT